MRKSQSNPGISSRLLGPVGIVAIAELFGTSLWFSANSAAPDLIRLWGATASTVGLITNAVQLGFIAGTLTLALSGLADRFPASWIFIVSAVFGALCNAIFVAVAADMPAAIAFRVLVGISLAGIYPIGMKLIIGWEPQRAGAALSLLVGMLTLGTALPHGLRAIGAGSHWQLAILISSGLALAAAVLIHRLGDGPHLARQLPGSGKGRNGLVAFRSAAFRSVALGYFGHMWELYAFWALCPSLITLAGLDRRLGISPSLLAFTTIGTGAIGCLLGGALSRRIGSAAVAGPALAISGACCLCFPFVAKLSLFAALPLLFVWAGAVIADSPHFSALAARTCPNDLVGSALAIQNAIGFGITVASIALTSRLLSQLGLSITLLLLPGPILGLLLFRPAWVRAEGQPAK